MAKLPANKQYEDPGVTEARRDFRFLLEPEARNKAGRRFGTKAIDSPSLLWELFLEYVNDIRLKPLIKVEQKKGTVIYGKGFEGDAAADIVGLPIMRPLTMEGFENYVADQEIAEDLSQYFSNRENRYSDYVAVCLRIKRTIRQDQIEGGMAGVYNPSITQRLNNLVDKSAVEITTEQPLFPDAD